MTEETTIEEKQNDSTPPPSSRNAGTMIAILLSLLALVITLAAAGYGYMRFMTETHTMSRAISSLKEGVLIHKDVITGLQQQVGTMADKLVNTNDLQAQQTRMLAEWHAAQKGDINKWHVAEAQYLYHLADDQLQFTHNVPVTIEIVRRAQQILGAIADNSVLSLRESVAHDLASLQALPTVDTTGIYLRLSALDRQIAELPLSSHPLQAEAVASSPVSASTTLPWWKKGLQNTWENLRQIIIVRKYDASELPLALPEEKNFLYQNLRAQLENAKWGVLQRNNAVYQASLSTAMAWIKQYMDQQSTITRAVLQNLEELQTVTLQTPEVNLSETLKRFDHYFADNASSTQSAR